MRLGCWLLMFGLMLTSLAHAQPLAEAQLRATLTPSHATWVGQPMTLQLDVLVPTWFLRAPRFHELQVTGAMTIPLPGSVNLSERRHGSNWSGLRRSYLIVPMAAGTLRLPSQSVEVTYAGADHKQHRTILTTPPLVVVAVRPPMQERVVVTSNLSLDQSFDRPLENLQPGDALVRTVRISAPDVPAMVLPTLEPETPEGAVLYRESPQVRDHLDRRKGFEGGERSERWTYVVHQPGRVQLPPLQISWWNSKENRAEVAQLPAVVLQVSNPGIAIDRGWWWAVTVLPLLAVLWRWHRRTFGWFLALVSAWLRQDAAGCYRALWRRHQQFHPPGAPLPSALIQLEAAVCSSQHSPYLGWRWRVLAVLLRG